MTWEPKVDLGFGLFVLSSDVCLTHAKALGLNPEIVHEIQRTLRRKIEASRIWEKGSSDANNIVGDIITGTLHNLPANAALQINNWFYHVSSTNNPNQPVVSDWFILLTLYDHSFYQRDAPPYPVELIASLVESVTIIDYEEELEHVPVESEWDLVMVERFKFDEDNSARYLAAAISTTIQYVEFRTLWSDNRLIKLDRINWTQVEEWGNSSSLLPWKIKEPLPGYTLDRLLPLPAGILLK